MLKVVFNKIASTKTLKNLSILMSGSMVTALIPIITAPITARLYEPEQFGIWALINAGSAILGVIAFSHFPHLIILEKDDDEAVNALHLSLFTNLLVCIVSVIFITIYIYISYYQFHNPFNYWLYIIPVFTFFNGIISIFFFWANRQVLYKTIATQRFLMVLIPTSLQILLGIFRPTTFSIIFSQFIGIFVTAILLSFTFRKIILSFEFQKQKFYTIAKKNKQLILVSLPTDIINNFSNQLPIFFLKKFSLNGPAAVGFYSLSNRLFSIPVSFMTSAIGEIFRQKAAYQYNTEGNCRRLVVKTVATLFLICIFPFAICMIYAPDIFAFVFSEKWRPAGYYARLIGILFFFKTVVSPVSYTIFIARKYYVSLIMDICVFLISVIAIYIGVLFFNSIEKGILFYSLTYGLLYILTFYLSYKYSINKNFKHA